MDQVEAEFRQRELELEKTKFAYAQLNDRQQRRSAMWTVMTSTTLSALAVIITVVFSVRQLRSTCRRFVIRKSSPRNCRARATP